MSLASVAQTDFITSLIRQLGRTGVLKDQDKIQLKKIRDAMKDAQTVEELPGAQAAEWIEELLDIKDRNKRG